MKQKYILLVGLIAFITVETEAQIPPNEFQLLLSATSLSLAKGESDSVHISVLRSKTYKKGKAVLNLTSPDKSGIAVQIQPIPDQPDSYVLHISVNEQAEAGYYNIIPSCTLNNKSKGAILKVTVK